MKKGIMLTLLFGVILVSLTAIRVHARNGDKGGYLIISNNFCIVVRSPSEQLTSSVGRNDLGIILKDKKTRISINGDYLAISAPLNKLEETIKKYHLQYLTKME